MPQRNPTSIDDLTQLQQLVTRLKFLGAGLKSWQFALGLAVKLALGMTLASSFYAGLFIPFVNEFVSSGFQNPYDHWVTAGRPEMFPYPALMLYILTVPRVLFGWLIQDGQVGMADLLIYRLPLLIADVGLLLILNSWLRGRQLRLLYLYWLSPLLIYITYIHGQLDIVPITLLFFSLYLQFKDKLIWSSVVLALAISAKTNMVLALPFYAWFIYTRHQEKALLEVVKHVGIIIGLFLLINLPFLTSPGFQEMVFNNREQRKVYSLHYDFGQGLTFYVLPAAFLMLLARSLAFRIFNKDLYIMFLGFAFGLLTLLIPPMPGWYYWVVPFLVYFVIKQPGVLRVRWSLSALVGCFFVYFMLVPASDFLQVFQVVAPDIAKLDNLNTLLIKSGINPSQVLNLVFTLLQASLAINCVLIYQHGIATSTQHKIRYKPYLVGVGGDSGSGKSTFTGLMEQLFGGKNVSIVRGDDMHRWERGHEKWQSFTHLDPKANHLHNDLMHAMTLKRGRRIDRRHYDHKDGKFTAPLAIKSNRVVVFEGLHPFFLSHMRKIYDLKVFINPDQDLRYHWKILRDTAKRGYSHERIMQQIKAREEDAKRYIQTQEKYADLVISYCTREPIAQVGYPDQDFVLQLRCTLENNVSLDALLEALSVLPTLVTKHDYTDDDHQVLVFEGTVAADDLSIIAQHLVPDLEEVIMNEPNFTDGYNGLIQLLVAYYVFNKIELDAHHV